MSTHRRNQNIRLYSGSRTSINRTVRDICELINCRYILIGKATLNGTEIVVVTVDEKSWVVIDG
jgi:hypothetical protein